MSRKKGQGNSKVELQGFWCKQIDKGEKFQEKWLEHARKVYARYEDERQDSTLGEKKVNIFYSNVNTLKESLYNSPPKPDVKRLHQGNYNDDIARVAALLCNRGLTYEIHCAPHFDAAIKDAILDRLVPGMGQVWVRFGVEKDRDGQPVPKTEQLYVDYVYWQDFLYSPARTWEKVWWVARKKHMSKKEVAQDYGQDVANQLGEGMDGNKDESTLTPKEINQDSFCVYEIWDKRRKQVIHLMKGMDEPLRVLDDPYKLQKFFPCPRPLISNVTTNKFLPITDYHLAQDQYAQLDSLYMRIHMLQKALRVAGVYDSSFQGLQRIFEQADNTLVPVDQWAAYAERGGLQGAIQFVPINEIGQVLQMLMGQFEATKSILYEVTGMSDIIRGASNQYETAAAQEIKAQFASVRMNGYQRDVATFVRDVLRIMSELMFQLYSPDKLMMIIGDMQEPDQQFIPQAYERLRDDFLSKYTVDIQANSLTQADWALEKEQRMEIIQTLGQMLGQLMPMVEQSEELGPLVAQMVKFGITGLKGSAELEGWIDQQLDAMLRAAQEKKEQPPEPSPEEKKMQMEMQMEQQKNEATMQMKQAEMQGKMQIEQQKLQLELVKMNAELEHQKQMNAIELEKAMLDLQIKQREADMNFQNKVVSNEMDLENRERQQELAAQQPQKGESEE